MKMEVSGDGQIVLKEVYNSIGFKTNQGEQISICMRDGGFEFIYNDELWSAKDGKVEKLSSAKDYPMWEELYGKKVSMGDRFETEVIWSEQYAHTNRGRWVPLEIKS